MIGYHFLRADPAARHPEDREIVIGQTHRKASPIRLGGCGYHAACRPMDALRQAAQEASPICMKVRLGGEIIVGHAENVASERTALAICDATEMIRKFSRQCVQDVLGAWDAPAVVMEYLRTADKELAADALAAIGGAWVGNKRGDDDLRAFIEARPNLPEIAFVYGALAARTLPPDYGNCDSYPGYAAVYTKAQVTFDARPVQPWQTRLTPMHNTPEAFLVFGAMEDRLNTRLGALIEREFRSVT